MASHAEVCARYIQAMRWPNVRRISSRSVFFEGNTLYSYGRHFPLAEYYPAGKHGRTAPLMLLNGDRNSVTTARHQSCIRGAVHGLTTWPELQVIILPFSALDAAGINRRTIRPLEVRPDRFDEWTEPVPGDFNAIQWGPIPVADESSRLQSQTGAVPGGNGAHAVRYLRHWDYAEQRFVERDPETAPVSFYTASGSGIKIDSEGNGYTEHRRHWLGDSLFTAEVSHRVTRTRPVTVLDIVYRGISAARHGSDDMDDIADDVRSTVTVTRRRKFISSFDYQEPGNLYFLATMPNGRAKTVDDAILELAPRAVHAAMARGIDVERQGDIFAIATPLTDSDVYGRAVSRARRTQWTNGAMPRKGEIGAPDHARRHRHAVADRKEIRRRYHVLRASQWAQWDTLPDKPRAVRAKAMNLAGNRGRHRLYRDSFSHALNALDGATRATMAKYEPSRERARRDLRTALAIHGTAHTATEVVRTRGGATYVRGIMYHEPSLEPGRNGERDHIRRPLGDRSTWYLALRNTVPRAS